MDHDGGQTMGEEAVERWSCCIDFGGSEIKTRHPRSGGAVVRTATVPAGDGDLERAAPRPRPDRRPWPPPRRRAAGIAVPGVVDRAAGSLVKAHDKHAAPRGPRPHRLGRDRFGAPGRDRERRPGGAGRRDQLPARAAGARDAVLMTLGTGIGTAAIMDGTLLRGAHDHAGILGGHLTVDIDAPTVQLRQRRLRRVHRRGLGPAPRPRRPRRRRHRRQGADRRRRDR